MSIPKIFDFVTNFGIVTSHAHISTILTKNMDQFHDEKDDIYEAMLKSTPYQHLDDTQTIVNGVSHYTQIICNEHATVFFTTTHKDRLTILDVLRNFSDRMFIFNAEAFELVEKLKLPKKTRISLENTVKENSVYNETELNQFLDNLVIKTNRLSDRHKIKIKEACGIAYYHQDMGWPIIELLITDDAPQFKLLTQHLLLCWIHEGRHYKRLAPVVPQHEIERDDFIKSFWEFYKKLVKYKAHPYDEQASILSKEFDKLFSKETNYDELACRISKTKEKKEALLTLLKYPQALPHNNPAELGARLEKRRSDVSLQTKTKEGTKAKETMMTIVETCRKLKVSAFKYIFDRMNHYYHMPSLSKLIKSKSNQKIYDST